MTSLNKQLFKYNSTDFQKILSGGVLRNLHTREEEDFKIENIISLKNIIFESEYDLQIASTGYPIKFINCYFKKRIQFNSNERHGLKFIFESCLADSELFFKGQVTKIEIIDCERMQDIKIITDNNMSEIEATNSCFNNLSISTPSLFSGLSFNEVKANSFSFKSQNCGIIKILKSEFSLVDFSETTFKSTLTINESKIHSKLNFLSCLFRSQIIIEGCEIQKFENKRPTERYRMVISDTEIKDFLLQLNDISFAEISLKNESNITITGALKDESSCTIYSSTLNSLLLNKVRVKDELTFANVTITKNGVLSFTESNLGKTKILNCTFAKSKFDFKNSQISEIFIADTDFPYTVSTNSKFEYAQARLVFGQLQKVFEQHGDSVRHYEYQAREIEAYYKILKPFRPVFPFINFAKINLWLNSISSNFGKSWAKGILFTLIVGSIFFNLTLNSTVKYDFSIRFNTDMLGPYLKFMNPLRHFDIENLFSLTQQNGIGITPLTHLFDFIGRIFVAYGYYQTIQAFRRFGRK